MVKTNGIVLRSTRYGETSVILQVFTEELGLQSFIINGVRKSKAKLSPALIQPLHLLEMLVYNKTGASVLRASELRNTPSYCNIPFDTRKTAIVFFLNEVILKTLKQGHEDRALFSFIYHELLTLDAASPLSADFHIQFVINLTRFLGISPAVPNELFSFFDLKNGVFTQNRPLHPLYLESELTRVLASLLEGNFEQELSREGRNAMLRFLMEYYAWHIDGFGTIRSLDILADTLR